MSSKVATTERALCYGAIAGLSVACIGAEAPVAILAGATLALTTLLPRNTVSHIMHCGRVEPFYERPIKAPRPRRPPKPTGYHYGAFGR